MNTSIRLSLIVSVFFWLRVAQSGLIRSNIVMNLNIDFFEELTVPPNSSLLKLHFTGGVSASQTDKGWVLGPVPVDGMPHLIGFIPEALLYELLTPHNVLPLFFEQRGVSDGVQHSFYFPWKENRGADVRSAEDLWSAVASNMKDESEREKELARHIHLSLTSVSVHLSRITAFYDMQLTGAIHSKKKINNRFSNATDKEIAASVHDFYAALGTARDHLAALIALRLGKPKRIDDLARLLTSMKGDRFFRDPMIGILLSDGEIICTPTKWMVVGELREIGLVRKRLVHNTPYGSLDDERGGRLVSALEAGDMQLRVYERMFKLEGNEPIELHQLLRRHYLFAMKLFEDMAKYSGYNSEIKVLTGDDIISISIDGSELGPANEE